MERRPVISSTVASIGHDDGILEIEYKDGTVYSCAATDQQVLKLMLSKSLGEHLHEHFAGRLVKSVDTGSTKPLAPVASGLDLVTPDACCQGPLQKALRSGKLTGLEWECPRCGAGWICQVDGEVRNWKPEDVLQLFRLPANR